MFEGFEDVRVSVGEVDLRVRHGGAGPPVLLVHGHPRTGATWHLVAPRLVAAGFTVVSPDMRGYGSSGKAEVLPDHSQQSKRTVAADLVELMRVLGHRRFGLVGHDRGTYVALRVALDHPDVVSRLVVMEGVPISEALARCDATFAKAWFHWFFYAQPSKPEQAILADPDEWYVGTAERMGHENHEELRAATRDPATVVAMLEDYRAGLSLDRAHEEQDRAAGRKVRCPTMLLWASGGDMEQLYGDPMDIWRAWAPNLTGSAVTSGHHIAEDSPVVLTGLLASFFGPAAA